MPIHPRKCITSDIPTSNSAPHGHLATRVPWEVCSSGLHVRSIQFRNRKSPKSEAHWQWVSYKAQSSPLGHSFEEWMLTTCVPNPCPPSAFPSLRSESPHEENNLQLSSAFLGFSYLFGSQTQKLRSKDGTRNPLKHKNKTWYFHKATKKRHLVWLSYSPEFSPELRGKGSYISQHGHGIHLYDWKRMFLFALHYTHKFHPLSKSNYCWPPKYIKFGFKSVTFKDLLQPTS